MDRLLLTVFLCVSLVPLVFSAGKNPHFLQQLLPFITYVLMNNVHVFSLLPSRRCSKVDFDICLMSTTLSDPSESYLANVKVYDFTNMIKVYDFINIFRL